MNRSLNYICLKLGPVRAVFEIVEIILLSLIAVLGVAVELVLKFTGAWLFVAWMFSKIPSDALPILFHIPSVPPWFNAMWMGILLVAWIILRPRVDEIEEYFNFKRKRHLEEKVPAP